MFREIWVDEKVKDLKLTDNILSKVSNIPIKYTKDCSTVISKIKASLDPVRKGKKVLLLTQNKGPFLVSCPGTKNYVCCGYKILNLTTNCNLDCSYCILQAYFFNNPIIQIFTNLDSMSNELNFLNDSFYRIGTGEFTDSLSLDDITGFTKFIIPFFTQKKNAILELKTKTANIKNLLNIKDHKNIIISWSLNPPKIIKEEESGTASLSKRLESANVCETHKYALGFHFDPIIRYPNWEKDYKKLIDTLFSNINPEHIIWISLGTLRFMPTLKPIIEERFPNTSIIYDEFITGLDDKLRYFKPIRIDIYQKVLSWIREYSDNVFVYLCMESTNVWEKVFGYRQTTAGLSNALDKRAKEFFKKGVK
ncbi:hypothetical protein KAW65_04645 [candidate division WOR-3 bacterium]|nr:hypothetical protein [candidate division WOR-3 bacterium]